MEMAIFIYAKRGLCNGQVKTGSGSKAEQLWFTHKHIFFWDWETQ